MARVEHEGHPAVRLSAGDLEAVFVPEVGMVGASLCHRGRELLGRRAGLTGYAERGKTFGIPLLHPWANRLSRDAYSVDGRTVHLPAEAPHLRREENGLPIHGLLAASDRWQVVEAGASRLEAALDFGAHDDYLALFPFPHSLAVVATVAPGSLSIETRVTATSDAPVPIAFGWHPYFRLAGSPRAEWELGLPSRRRRLTDDRGVPTGETERCEPSRGPLGDRTYDDGYDHVADGAEFTLGPITVVHKAGYPAAQLYAPPSQDIVAIEPMTAPTDALVTGDGLRLARPGEPFTARFSIAVR